MNRKYFCPHHTESTPSAVAYSDRYYSFCCGKSGPLSELGLKEGERIDYTYIEDLASSIAAIRALPQQEIRGLKLHADSNGYYIIYPNDAFYKRRVYGADSGSKYRGPAGHSKPWFYARTSTSYPTIVLVEGELNSMSLDLATEGLPFDIVSPGGAGDFMSSTAKKEMQRILQYSTIHVIVDSDAAGVKAAIETKSYLTVLGHDNVKLHLVKTDFNDTLVNHGKEALKEVVRDMGL